MHVLNLSTAGPSPADSPFDVTRCRPAAARRDDRAHPASPLRASAAAVLAAGGAVLGAGLGVAPAWAQSSAAAPASSLPAQQVVITGNPLQRDALAQPASVLSGEPLLLRRASTLGETLDGLPGVASTWFGPNAGRPVIRGLDGDRIRLLDNGGASVDASGLSFDHAVALDPLVVERVEVLRGPAALLYGGNATGGAVNTLDNRIPRQPASGLSGRAELRIGGAADERSVGVLLEGGAPPVAGSGQTGGLAWHVDAFDRRSSDLRVPRHVPREGGPDGEPLEASTRVRNSAADGRGGAVGAGWAGRDGFLGLSADTMRTNYGVTAEEGVTIRLRRDRLSAAGEWRGLPGWSAISFQASDTDYQHQEVEGSGEVGTTFDSRGQEFRLQGRHAPIAGIEGVIGLQSEDLRFEALGEEAFVPGTRTRSQAVFLLESVRIGAVEWSAGLRQERVRVSSDGDAADVDEPRFGDPRSRRFSPRSLSLGAVWSPVPAWRAHLSLGRTQRAPAYHELYADGLHLATAAYERGDPGLGLEKSVHAEVGLAWQSGDAATGRTRLAASAYLTRFSNFIALNATGEQVEVEDEETGGTAEVPLYQVRGVPARLHGLELEASTGGALAGWGWQLDAGLDLVRGHQTDTGEALPRLAPVRLRLAGELTRGDWRFGATLARAGRQDRVPVTDVATDGHTRLDVSLRWRQRGSTWAGAEATWFLRGTNLTDALAYQATTIGSLRGLVPLPGRALSAGVQVAF